VGECDQPTLRAEEVESQLVEFLIECQRCLPTDWRARLEAQWNTQYPEAAQQLARTRNWNAPLNFRGVDRQRAAARETICASTGAAAVANRVIL